MDCVRAEDAYTSRLGYEEHIPGQVKALNPAADHQEEWFQVFSNINFLVVHLDQRLERRAADYQRAAPEEPAWAAAKGEGYIQGLKSYFLQLFN